jgi:hypothetical protein
MACGFPIANARYKKMNKSSVPTKQQSYVFECQYLFLPKEMKVARLRK